MTAFERAEKQSELRIGGMGDLTTSTFANPSNAYVYLLIDTGMNIPRILALGIVIGYLYKRLYGQA